MSETKQGRGRPTKLTPEIIEQARSWLPVVLYLETFAEFIGVTRQTVHGWLNRGKAEASRIEKGEEPNPTEALFVEFFDTVKKAVAKGQYDDLATIQVASKQHWQAAAWRLERRFPDRWGSQKRELAELKRELIGLQRTLGGNQQGNAN